MDDETETTVDRHREIVQSILQTQMEMPDDGAMMFDYVRQLNVWAAQACGQLLSIEQRLLNVESRLAAQQSRGDVGDGSANGEGKKA